MSKKIGPVLIFCLIFLTLFGPVWAQGGNVTGLEIVHPSDKPCVTYVYFELTGFTPGAELYEASIGYTEVSCETGQVSSGSWPLRLIGTADQNGHYRHGSYIGGVSGTYTALFTDNVTSVTFSFTTNENGDVVSTSYQKSGQNPAPPTVPDNPIPDNPIPQTSGGQYPQGHEGVSWGGIHFGNYCAVFGQSEYNDGSHGRSWGCGGQTLDHNTICHDIYGDDLPFAQYGGDGLNEVSCGSTPSNGNAGWTSPPETMPGVTEKWCAVQKFDTNPNTDHFDPGTQVSLFGRGGDCRYGNNGLPRATRYSIDGVLFGEKQQSENYDTWNTSTYSQGTHTVCFMVASDRDPTWEHRDEQCRTYTIGGAGVVNPPVIQNPPVVSNDCPGVLPSLVQTGTIAVVNTVSRDYLNVRSSPHVAKETKIDRLAPRSTFSIISGPICAEGYRWWEIGYNGKSGYSAEANAIAYNFVPNGTSLPYNPTGVVQNPPVVVQPPVVNEPTTVDVSPVPSTQDPIGYENLMGNRASTPISGATYYQPGAYPYIVQFGEALATGKATSYVGDITNLITSAVVTSWNFDLIGAGASGFEIACTGTDFLGLFNNPLKDPENVRVVCVLFQTAENTVVVTKAKGVVMGSLYFLIQALSNDDIFIDSWLTGLNQYMSGCPLSSFVARKMGLPPPRGCLS